MSVYLSRSPYLTSQKRSRRRNVSRGGGFVRKRNGGTGRKILQGMKMVRFAMNSASKSASSFVSTSGESMSAAAKALKDVGNGKRKIEIGPGTVMISLGVFSMFLSLAYLAHFNSVATKGYELRRLEVDRQQLLNQYEIKNMRLAEVMALQSIITSETVDGMRRPSETNFVRGNSALAAR